MNISQNPSNVPASADADSDYASALRRDLALAVVIAVLLLIGVTVGGSLAAREEPLLAQPVEVSEAELPLAFDYFASNYINQGVESSEELPTF